MHPDDNPYRFHPVAWWAMAIFLLGSQSLSCFVFDYCGQAVKRYSTISSKQGKRICRPQLRTYIPFAPKAFIDLPTVYEANVAAIYGKESSPHVELGIVH